MKTNNLSRTAIALTVISLASSLAQADPPMPPFQRPTTAKSVASTAKADPMPKQAVDTKDRNRLLSRLLEIREDAKASITAASETRAERLQIEQTLRAYFEERRAARELTASGKGAAKPSIIGHIATRKIRVTIRNGANGPVYELRSKDGKTILADQLTPDQLHAYDPKLHAIVDQAMAGKKSPDGSYIDARRYAPATVTPAARIFERSPSSPSR
jgi:cytochrome P450